MPVLAQNHYGKSRVRLLKVTRTGEQHEVREWTVGVYLEGDFEACFTLGDNTGIVATDTMKNTVYSVARNSPATTMEDFALELAHFLAGRAQQTSNQPAANQPAANVRITVEEKLWVRLKVDGVFHGSSFLQRGPERDTTSVSLTPGAAPAITSGVTGLVILKTAHSAFHGFDRDELTTLPETSDRLLGTEATITWLYAAQAAPQAGTQNSAQNSTQNGAQQPTDFAATRRHVLDTLLGTFATHQSLSVQHTLFAMAEAALAAEPTLVELSLTMPNRHNLPVDFSRFTGEFRQDNPNTIFMPTDEPHGHIHARVTR